MKKKKPVATFLIIIAAVVVYFYQAWEEKQYDSKISRNTPVSHLPTAVPDQVPPGLDEPLVSREGASWPYLGNEAAVALAPDLMARNFVLIYDSSGSMADDNCSAPRMKYQAAKEAVSDWAMSLPEEANLGLVAFHGQWTTLGLVSGQKDGFIQAISPIMPRGSTPLTQAVQMARDMLTEQGRMQLGYGEYTIVVVTDGEADDMPSLDAAVDRVLTDTPIVIYTIGFCIGEHHSLNQPGRTVYRTANNPEELRKGLEQATAESETFDVLEFK